MKTVIRYNKRTAHKKSENNKQAKQ